MALLNKLSDNGKVKTAFGVMFAATIAASAVSFMTDSLIIREVVDITAISVASLAGIWGYRTARRVEGGYVQRDSVLANVTSSVMVADENNVITYINPSVTDMLRNAESDIRKELPSFNVDTLVGTSIDTFHKNPAHQRGMLAGLESTYRTSIEIGDRIFDLVANPIKSPNNRRMGTVVEWKDVSESRVAEQRNARIQTSLDCVSSNVMLADENNNIIYMNEAVLKMMEVAESDIKTDLPNFDTTKLIGSNIDMFHKNPAHQRGMLESLKGTYETTIRVGGRIFDLIANPVLGTEGERLGTVVEWADVTAEEQVKKDVQQVVDGCVQGDFTRRISTEGKEGFMLALAQGINQIGEISLRGLNETKDVISSLSNGDLTLKMEGDYAGSFDEIKVAVNSTIDKLKEMVGQIQDTAQSVNSASNEISSGSTDLSQRTEQQASTLEETSASMEELTSTVKQNTDNAQDANKKATDASDIANKGGEVVQDAVVAMGNIIESSKKISDIIGVIDEIAFQTNLLALNAAVEAARAGDAGKGFAVVASEVRTLAGRSAEASKEIKYLIEESTTQVDQGSALVNNAGETLKEIVESVSTVAQLIDEIANASEEQATGLEEINTAVSQMDESTQQNAALVEENSASAVSLVDQSEELENLITFFVIDENENQQHQRQIPQKIANSSNPAPKASKQPRAEEPIQTLPKTKKAVGGHDGWEEF